MDLNRRAGLWRYLTLAAVCFDLHSASAQQPSPNPLFEKHLVSIDEGRKINMVCIGHGSPTVVFEYGLGGHMLNWQKVQTPVAEITRACFYDRAGYGFSDPPNRPMTAENVAADLHELLHRSGEGLPVVLVGHSIGGLYATLYADKYPDDVAGMMLIDPSFADQQPDLRGEELKIAQAEFDSGQSELFKCASLAWQGKLKLADPHDCFQPAPNRTAAELNYLMEQFTKPYRYESTASEMRSFSGVTPGTDQDSLQEKTAMRSFGSMPLIVLTAGKVQPPQPGMSQATMDEDTKTWRAGHDRLAARSTNGRNVIVPDAGHYIQVDEPQAVVNAIKTVVEQTRNSSK